MLQRERLPVSSEDRIVEVLRLKVGRCVYFSKYKI